MTLALDARVQVRTHRDDRRRLSHHCRRVILFTRTTRSAQLSTHTDIHSLKSAPLLIGVDHEAAGTALPRRVTRLPPMRTFGEIWNEHPKQPKLRAKRLCAGGKLRAHALDFSFARVLDLDYGASRYCDVLPWHAAHRIRVGSGDAGHEDAAWRLRQTFPARLVVADSDVGFG